MKKITYHIMCLLIAALYSSSSLALGKGVIAKVNGVKITQKQYQQQLKFIQSQNPKGNQSPVSRQLVINDLITREILLQEAKKLKLHKDKKVKAILKLQKNNVLIQTLISRNVTDKAISDKELKKVYNKQVANADQKEYKARHILVKDEAKAKELIGKLNDGADFEELAKKESTGPSGKSGGDLGWFSSKQMVPAFSKATAELKKGTHTQKPVKTRFGFHIIKLEDSRTREVPKFADVKPQLIPIVKNIRIQEYVLKLRNKAKIEVR